MAAPIARGGVTTAILAKLRAFVALTTYVGTRIYPNSDGDAPTTPAKPYIQIESGSEIPFNTMGDPDALHWGSVVRAPIRVVSESRSDAQGNTITSLVRQALDGQPLSIAGYDSASIGFDLALPPLSTAKPGCPAQREFVSEYLVTVHQ